MFVVPFQLVCLAFVCVCVLCVCVVCVCVVWVLCVCVFLKTQSLMQLYSNTLATTFIVKPMSCKGVHQETLIFDQIDMSLHQEL